MKNPSLGTLTEIRFFNIRKVHSTKDKNGPLRLPGPRIFPKNNGEESVKSVLIKKLPPVSPLN